MYPASLKAITSGRLVYAAPVGETRRDATRIRRAPSVRYSPVRPPSFATNAMSPRLLALTVRGVDNGAPDGPGSPDPMMRRLAPGLAAMIVWLSAPASLCTAITVTLSAAPGGSQPPTDV